MFFVEIPYLPTPSVAPTFREAPTIRSSRVFRRRFFPWEMKKLFTPATARKLLCGGKGKATHFWTRFARNDSDYFYLRSNRVQPVTQTPDGSNTTACPSEFSAQPLNVSIDRMWAAVVGTPPHPAEQSLSAESSSLILKQINEQVKLRRREVDLPFLYKDVTLL